MPLRKNVCQQNNILFPVQIINLFFFFFFWLCVCVCGLFVFVVVCLFRDHTQVRLFCYFVFVCVFLALKSD